MPSQPTTQAEDPALGTRIAGRYLVEASLGRGGMGAVYRVRDETKGEVVALKRMLKETAAKATMASLFQREYHTLAQLQHPGVIEVYDYGIDDEGPYYTMELLDGRDLRKLAPLQWRDACRLLCDVASSLALLHSRRLLHRDVSARNVRCTADGRAKLMDFGALITMGVASKVIGTPPYLAPESIQRQPLDQRSDLYSLGALAYWLMTGRHAYPARKLRELIDAWRTQPPPPSRVVGDIPRALDELVMSLLSLSFVARPASASEVVDRLNAIAGLEPREDLQTQKSYLATPALVGRDHETLLFRKQMIRALRGNGGTWVIEGSAGVGRSRLLHSFNLEAKLAGAASVIVDASNAREGSFGVARAVGCELLEALPDIATETAAPYRELLGRIIPALADGEDPPSSAELEELRPHLLAALRDWLIDSSARRCLFVAVDDVHAVDEPSAALLMAVGQQAAERKLVLAASLLSGSTPTAPDAVRVLSQGSITLALGELSAEGTETLLRSVFGDVPNVKLVADRIHGASQGNPAASMQLAQHLVDARVVRFGAGGWSLPVTLRSEDLPGSLREAFEKRIEALSDDARELAEALARCPGYRLSPSEYLSLTDGWELARMYGALDELVAAQVLLSDGEGYRFGHRGWISVLSVSTDENRERALHLKLATIFEGQGDTVRVAHHLLRGGAEAVGTDALLSQIETDPDAIYRLLGVDGVETLERALSYAEHVQRPARDRYLIRRTLADLAAVHDARLYSQYGAAVLEQQCWDSGRMFWEEAVETVAEADRLAYCLQKAQRRYESLPEGERVLAPEEALRQLARSVINALRACTMMYDLKAIDRLESLIEPFAGLTPTLAFIRDVVRTTKHVNWGDLDRARQGYRDLIDRLDRPDGAGLTEAQRQLTRLNLLYGLGGIEASMGLMSAMQLAAQLDAEPRHQVNAWRIRRIAHARQGNSAEADKCRERVELLAIQNSPRQSYEGTLLGAELSVHAASGNLMGVKECLESIAALARRYPGWRCWLYLARADYHRLRGDYTAARTNYEATLELITPGRHSAWIAAAVGYVQTLRSQGALELAYSRARSYMELAGEIEHRYYKQQLGGELALCEAERGDFEQAIRRVEAVIEDMHATGITGLNLGMEFETRARIAVMQGDPETFEKYARATAEQYRRGHNPTLTSRYEKLIEAARDRNISVSVSVRSAADQAGTDRVRAQEALDKCVSTQELSQVALDLLLERTDTRAGFLYLLREGELCLAAQRAPKPPPDALRVELQATVDKLLVAEHADATNETDTATSMSDSLTDTFVEEGVPAQGKIQSLPLTTMVERQPIVVGIAAIFHPEGRVKAPGYDFCRIVADSLHAGASRKQKTA